MPRPEQHEEVIFADYSDHSLESEDGLAQHASRFGKMVRTTLEWLAENPGAADDAGLAAAELITNADVHGGGLTKVVVARRKGEDGSATLEVTVENPLKDDGYDPEESGFSLDEPDSSAEHGRGLLIVNALSVGGLQRVVDDQDGLRMLRSSFRVSDSPRRGDNHPSDSVA